ncbi:PE family protein [Gordonia sp. ABSL1-1]|uniref:PE family protein n=1 Tax=Gordonia sp. ABSL1-1 TaxID=3053923 RepID=UPI0025745698|nr:PE family protein [Gordonia sp. ABSL1-1]MDL9936713.1 PE family protein [Gordonia sp. ABSL1-1]
MDDSVLRVDPAQLASAAGDIDVIVHRLEQALVGAGRTLPVEPAGRDEVSVAAAHSFTEVARRFGADTATGIRELRKIAAVLRAQGDGFAADEEAAARGLRA